MAKKPSNPRSFDLMQSAIDGVDLPKAVLVIPPAAKREPIDNWQIIVVGSIDSRQIGPQWLHLIGSISAEELKSGQKTLTTIVMPMAGEGKHIPQPNFVQFDVGAFAVTVVPDRWIIQTVTEANRSRLVEVSANVFRKLNEIYISAFGINKNWTVKLEKKTAGHLLGEKLAAADLSLPAGRVEGRLNYRSQEEAFDTNIQLSPSSIEEKWLEVNYNRHHQIKISPDTTYYDVGQMIIDAAEADWNSAAVYASGLLESVKRAEG